MQNVSKDRGRRVLKLLQQHGPLSFRGVKAMIEPKMKDRRIHDAIARLYRNGLIEKRQERVFRGAGVFYQISQHLSARHKIATMLNCKPEELKQSFFRSRELMHTEACALWMHRLRALFPDATLIRDCHFQHHPVVQEVLLASINDFEVRPDILLLSGANGSGHRITVGFEIEKSRKSERRLHAKLHKYANETALDGVVYLCDSTEISAPILRIYQNKIMQKSTRVSHYGEHFLLSQNEDNPYGEETKKTFTTCSGIVLVDQWMHELMRTPLNSRRDHFFTESAI